MENTLYVVMPAYNEEANIENVIAEWYPVLDNGDADSRLVVAAGGSNDHTLEILYELKSHYPKLEVLSASGTDHGTKVILLYNYAIKHHASWIFQTDSDGQTVASEFKPFWDLREKHDAVLGYRKIRGDGRIRKWIEHVLRLYLVMFFGVLIPDANAPFRLMKSSMVEKYLKLMPEDFNLPNAVLCACFGKFHENVVYRIITFQPRQGGKNYINMKRIIHIGYQSIHSFLEIRKNLKEYEMTKRS